MTAFIYFMQAYKEKHCAVAFKDLGVLWQELEAEEKRVFTQKAQQEKARYQGEMEVWLVDNPQAALPQVYFPLSRVRLILKADLSQRMVYKKDYLTYLNHSLEYFLKALV